MTIKLGDKIRDRITGFSGIAYARHDYLIGCARWSIMPDKLGKDGKPTETLAFDEPQIELIKAGAFKPKPPVVEARPGGPRVEPAARPTIPSR